LDVSDFPLDGPRANGTLILVSDEQNLNLAEPGCVTMMTMSKTTGALSHIERMDPNSYRGGWFSIAIGEGFIYCSGGAGGILYRRSATGGSVTEVLRLPDDHPEGYKPQVQSMLMVGSTLYLLRGYASEGHPSHRLARIDTTVEPALVDITDRIPALGGVMEHDEMRQALYWLSPLSVFSYSLSRSELRESGADSFTLDNHPYGSYLAQDEDYLYWHTRDPIVRVFRQRKLEPKIE
jgi:hypothetical protein